MYGCHFGAITLLQGLLLLLLLLLQYIYMDINVCMYVNKYI